MRYAAVAAVIGIASVNPAPAQSSKPPSTNLPGGFIYLRDIDPSIMQDIRYAGTNNFTGRRLAGYEAPECVVKQQVATALARVQADLKAKNLSLKMLDCYRPSRASRDMVAWANDGRETADQKRYNPKLNKRDLFKLGYIAAYSGHSTGAAVDLTLVDLSANNTAAFDPKANYADCTAPADNRAPEGSVDMGTGYDCSDAKAHTASPGLTPEQRQWRQTLVAAMSRQGFANYAKEWWHFSIGGVATGAFDFPITPRERSR